MIDQNIIFIVMPSSTAVPYFLARRISRHFRTAFYNDVFIKCTVEEVIKNYFNEENTKQN